MPLIFQKDHQNSTSIAVWHIEEDMDFFNSNLQLTQEEISMLGTMKPRRQKEWLASRFLADQFCPSECRIHIVKDPAGKPKLIDQSHHISISHSRDRVAFIRSDIPVGIDIQHHEEKIMRIRQKFISPSELAQIDGENEIESCHLFWSAKESMYKAWGKRELDFRRHIHLYPFKYYRNKLELAGFVKKENNLQEYDIYADKLGEYYLCYAISE